jgi:hypothetical protein
MSPKNGRSWFIHYAGSCDYEGPDWMKEVMEKEEESAVSRRRFLPVSQLRSYMDTQKRPYIQVIDGGRDSEIASSSRSERDSPQ